jgi:hypothetical protein
MARLRFRKKGKNSFRGANLLDKEAVAMRKLMYGECFTHDFVNLPRPEKNLLLIIPWPQVVVRKFRSLPFSTLF